MRRKLIAGNWKMNTTISESIELIEEIKSKISNLEIKSEILICPPFVNIVAAVANTKNSGISVGAQNCEYRINGAYTGEVSAPMLFEAGCQYVIIGHSERRTLYGETDVIVNQKLKTVISYKMTPILCIGENLDERNQNKTFDILKTQILGAYKNLSIDEISETVIAYEPVWAIGTGVSATNEQAAEAHRWIRTFLKEEFGDRASNIRILYGGSMNDANCEGLLSQEDIDGGLIGGASLKAASFVKIIMTAEKFQ
ncbi:triose-phosphate isomerase [Candidatus Kapaibacterium sp.]